MRRREKTPETGSSVFDLVCLDTDILIGFLRGDEKAASLMQRLEAERRAPTTTAITAYELTKGAQISSDPSGNLESVNRLVETVRVLPLTAVSCRNAARIYSELRGKGRLSGEFDVLIAGIVVENDETLVTRDGHFSMMKDVPVRSW